TNLFKMDLRAYLMDIDRIAQAISEISRKRESLATSLCYLHEINEAVLKHGIIANNLDNIKICGVDGGLLKKEYHGAGIIIRRAVAVCFEYKNGKLENTGYFPGTHPIPDVVITTPDISEMDFNLFAGLKREETELQACLGAIEKFSPDILIRDGSIVLYPSNMPEKDSSAHQTYKDVIKLYNELYKKCEEKNILLCGAVEDSRGKRYCNILSSQVIPRLLEKKIQIETATKIFTEKNILASTTDTLFLYYLLKNGERTPPIDYSESDLPALKDLEGFAKKIFVQYIKAGEFDRPLRIDFFSAPEKVSEISEKIAGIIYAISKQNRLYSFPSVLIEADGRAKLSEIELEQFKSALAGKLGRNPALFDLRREMRPF
ncbi:MAG: DNA double-strand break repair nuclease NurA, partial [Nanoarchaeota archaeon]